MALYSPISLPPCRAKTTNATRGIGEFLNFLKFGTSHRINYQLRQLVTFFDLIRPVAKIHQLNIVFATIAGIEDAAHRVQTTILGQTALIFHHRGIAAGEFEREANWENLSLRRLEQIILK